MIVIQKIHHDKTLGQNLRSLRIRAGLTQSETVIKMELEGCKTTRAIYSQIEMGIYNIRVDEVRALKRIFNATYEEIFEKVND